MSSKHLTPREYAIALLTGFIQKEIEALDDDCLEDTEYDYLDSDEVVAELDKILVNL